MSVGDKKVTALSACFTISMLLTGGQALAHGSRHHHGATSQIASHRQAFAHAYAGTHHHGLAYRVSSHGTRFAYGSRHHTRFAYGYGAHVIQCVAFAKQDAGIEISGNARDWWSNAAGIYERGARPESGSVLSFRANGRMPLGHVAVVSGIHDSRTIEIDQSHWNSRGITRDIEVKDVSENNDWSAVRVQLGHNGAFGSIYPTHGFIYPRPDRGTLVANETRAPMPAMDRAPADLRIARHIRHAALEVAEAPETSKPIDLTMPGISFDAPKSRLALTRKTVCRSASRQTARINRPRCGGRRWRGRSPAPRRHQPPPPTCCRD